MPIVLLLLDSIHASLNFCRCHLLRFILVLFPKELLDIKEPELSLLGAITLKTETAVPYVRYINTSQVQSGVSSARFYEQKKINLVRL